MDVYDYIIVRWFIVRLAHAKLLSHLRRTYRLGDYDGSLITIGSKSIYGIETEEKKIAFMPDWREKSNGSADKLRKSATTQVWGLSDSVIWMPSLTPAEDSKQKYF